MSQPPYREGAAAKMAEAVRVGTVPAGATVDRALERLTTTRAGVGGLNIVLWEDRDASRNDAKRVEKRLTDRTSADMALAGVPIAVKDNIATLSMPTSCGSRILEGYISPYEATAITRLRAAGAVVVAKTNCDEFAMGSSTEHSAYGPARNPIDPKRVPGGSSGGSAAAVAAGIVPIALGSETGGSVRQPAAFCGVVGIKPTYGRVSRYGLVAFASSLDQIGVFGKTVDDAARALEVIAGRDTLDSTSAMTPVHRYALEAGTTLKGLTVGIPKEYFPESLDPKIRELCNRSIDILRSLGATTRDISLPHTDLAIPAYYVIAPAEASSNLARFDGVRYGLRITGDGLRGMYEATRSKGFGAEVTRRILLGTYVLSAGYYDAYYKKAQEVRALIAQDFLDAFASGVNVIFTPTTPSTAFPLGAKSDPYEMYLSDIFTVTANLAGVPAMSQPIGEIDGLPVGGQFIAPHFGESRMLGAAYALEGVLTGASSAPPS